MRERFMASLVTYGMRNLSSFVALEYLEGSFKSLAIGTNHAVVRVNT